MFVLSLLSQGKLFSVRSNWAQKAIVLFIVYELPNNAQTSGDKGVMLWHIACTLGTARDTNQISSCT